MKRGYKPLFIVYQSSSCTLRNGDKDIWKNL